MELLTNPILIWFAVGLVLFILELVSPGLIMIFFAVGAWMVALICVAAKISINVQLFLFLIFSIVSLVIFRKKLTGVSHGHIKAEQDLDKDVDDFIGHHAVVKEEITPEKPGKIEFKGVLWTAEAKDKIAVETVVKIVKKDNLTLCVKVK